MRRNHPADQHTVSHGGSPTRRCRSDSQGRHREPCLTSMPRTNRLAREYARAGGGRRD